MPIFLCFVLFAFCIVLAFVLARLDVAFVILYNNKLLDISYIIYSATYREGIRLLPNLFLVGICIKRLTTNRTYSVAGMLLCLSLCGCILNQIFDIDNIRYSFFTIMASIFAVMVAITLPIKTSNIFARAGKNLSLYVYIFHWAVLDVINTYMVSNECSCMLLYSKAILLVMISLVVAFVLLKQKHQNI